MNQDEIQKIMLPMIKIGLIKPNFVRYRGTYYYDAYEEGHFNRYPKGE